MTPILKHVSWQRALIATLLLSAACGRTETAVKQDNVTADACAVILTAPPDNSPMSMRITRLQQQIRDSRQTNPKIERLGWLYVSAARSTNDPGFHKLAEQSAGCIEKSDPTSNAALLLRGHVLENLHRFHEAEQIARQLVANRESPFDYGLLGDSLMEQGRLDEASEAYQKMVDLRPGLESYSRAAHLRWLRGDLEGATGLMALAARSGSPRTAEPTAWAYARLAIYELQAKKFDAAMEAVQSALKLQPGYAPALLAQGRVLLARGENSEAIEPLTKAARLNPLPEYQWVLAEALRAWGKENEALAIEKDLEARGAGSDPRTFALYLATRSEQIDTAVKLAEEELNNRMDTFSYDALAWSLHGAGDAERARNAMQAALTAGTQDARLFLHAAVISESAGDKAEAARYRRKAETLRYLLLPSEREWLNARRSAVPAKNSSS